MTEDIKEILDYIDDRIIPNEKWNKIKDYITNLQQLYENALKVNQNENKYRTELEDKYVVLQQENEKLKYNARGQVNDYFKDKYADEVLKNAKLKEENKRLNNKVKEQNLLLIEFQDMEQKVDIYKSRCEKANKYINEEIKKIQEHQYSTGVRRLTKIQNILNGSDGK